MPISWSNYRPRPIGGGASSRADSQVAALTDRIHALEDRIDALALLCQAQWEIIRDNTGLDDEAIAAKAQEVDLRDGTADGKMGRASRDCPACQRPLHTRHDRCLYCGHEVGNEHGFAV